MNELTGAERIILAIDTSNGVDASRLVSLAKEAGARFVKMGLELSSATSWGYCSDLAAENEIDWVADAKLDDIPNTVQATVKNLKNLEHPPYGITMHTTAGMEAMKAAQEEAEDIKMLGVTILTSISPVEANRIYTSTISGTVMKLAINAARAGLKGVVSSPQEVGIIKSNSETEGLFAMIPGTRSAGVEQGDQVRIGTPAGAIQDGADLLVIGRQVTQAENPALAFQNLVVEIESSRNE